MTKAPSDDPDTDDEHLTGLPDGMGCTEIWDHLSERRESNDRSDGE